MSPAPLSKVIRIVAKASGKDPVEARSDIVDTINGVLEMLYRTEATRIQYFKADGCVYAAHFQENCRNNCATGTGFKGVVMPSGVINIRELRADEWAYQITEERVATGCGRFDPSLCNPRAEHLPPRLLERDIPGCGDNRVVTFRSSSQDDCGKLVGVSYLDMNGSVQREDILLGITPMGTSVSVAEFMDISFPERCGWLTAETAEGAPLGRYHPSILSPRHEWFRLEHSCAGRIQWRGMMEPHPLVFDTDVVPFSDTYLWSIALKAYEFRDTLDLTPAQAQGLNRMFAALAAVTAADLASENTNFNTRVIAGSARSAMSAARLMSTNGSRGNHRRYR